MASRGSRGPRSRCGTFYSRSCFGRRRAEVPMGDGSGLWDAQSQRASKASRGAPRRMCARRFAPLERVESVVGRLLVRGRFSSGKRERPRRGARGRLRRKKMLYADGVRRTHVGSPSMHSVCSPRPRRRLRMRRNGSAVRGGPAAAAGSGAADPHKAGGLLNRRGRRPLHDLGRLDRRERDRKRRPQERALRTRSAAGRPRRRDSCPPVFGRPPPPALALY